MAVLGVVIGLDRTHSHRLYHIMYLTPPPPHLTHACPRTLINHIAFLHRASLATILQHWLWARGVAPTTAHYISSLPLFSLRTMSQDDTALKVTIPLLGLDGQYQN